MDTSIKNSIYVLLLFSFIFPINIYAQEDNIGFGHTYVGGHVGMASVNNSNYKNSPVIGAYAGIYLVSALSLELSPMYMDEFELKGQNQAHIDVRSVAARLAYKFQLSHAFSLRPSAGMYYSDTRSYFSGKNTGKDTDQNVTYGLSGLINIKNVVINIDLRWYKEVSGQDISVATVGAGYEF